MTTPQSIIKTLAWFSSINFPITEQETYRYLLGDETSKAKFSKTLESLVAEGTIETHQGYYAISNIQKLVTERKHQYRLAEQKYRKTLRVVKILKLIPWIKLISVCNTLGFSHATENSDVDIFIITQRKKLWTTRFFVISFLKIFGLRPLLASFGNYPEKRKDRIDASFFIDEDHLSIKHLAIEQDIYLWFWIILQTPIYDTEEYYQKFLTANNWLREYIPNYLEYMPSKRRSAQRPNKILGKLLFIASMVCNEYICKKTQLHILPALLKQEANQTTNVVINDTMLKFHHKDRRITHRDQWINLLKKLSL